MFDGGNNCETCGVRDPIYSKNHTVTHLKDSIIIQLKRFTLDSKIHTPVNVDEILAVGLFNGYVLTSAILHKGQTKNCGHYTGIIRGTDNNTWVMTDDSRAQVIQEDVAKELLRREGYILFYSNPENLPEPLKGVQRNRATMKEPTSGPKRRVPKQMKSSSTREQVSSFKTDDGATPVKLPEMPYTSQVTNFQLHSPSEEELAARIPPNEVYTHQPIIDPNEELVVKQRNIFGHNNFRSVEQLEATRALIVGHRDVLVVMPTGKNHFSMFIFDLCCSREWKVTHLPIGCTCEKPAVLGCWTPAEFGQEPSGEFAEIWHRI